MRVVNFQAIVLILVMLGLLRVSRTEEASKVFDKDNSEKDSRPKKRRPPGRRRTEFDDKDWKAVEHLKPLKDSENVMFWRPQKVGSSTVLSLLMSYGYRYNFLPRRKTGNNAVCRKLAKCALSINATANGNLEELERIRTGVRKGHRRRSRPTRTSVYEQDAENLPVKISLQHEICYGKVENIKKSLPCAFSPNATLMETNPTARSQQVKELFMVREPVSRAISSYYFWGELYRMSRLRKVNATNSATSKTTRKVERKRENDAAVAALNARRKLASPFVRLGESADKVYVKPVQGRFKYHGVENTVPPIEYAMAYANKPPFRPGMPGPSLAWSLFANTIESALEEVRGDRMVSIVLERLDDSLIVARHYLGWSLADIVVTKQRKALSNHPKKDKWPAAAVQKMHDFFVEKGDSALYNATVEKLDSRLAQLQQQGVDLAKERTDLKALRKKVSKTCLNMEYLDNYRVEIGDHQGLPLHPSKNKLRDVEDIFQDKGHLFSLNKEILGSFDVCGSCEAHAALLAVQAGSAPSIEAAPRLQELDRKLIKPDNIDFSKCPKFFTVAAAAP